VEIKQLFQLTLDGGNSIPSINSEALFVMRKNKSGRWKIMRWEDKAAF
jgi:ketosteroid isomerase-like protein